MAKMECKVYQVESVENHPDADRLSIIKLKGLGYTCISNKLEDGSSRYKVDDYVVYIGENALIPQWLLAEMGMWDKEKNKGILAGTRGDRCKAIRLRGIYSEGILYPVTFRYGAAMEHVIYKPVEEFHKDILSVDLGDDVSEFLGVTKYEPVIPESMSGEVFGAGDIFYHYDIEPLAKHPDILKEGEEVKITEKIHGTQIRIQFRFDKVNPSDGCFHIMSPYADQPIYVYIASKGLGDGGKCFKNNEKNQNNVYVKAFHNTFDPDTIEEVYKMCDELSEQGYVDDSITFYGEVFGNTQDLHYGILANEPNKINFFDIAVDKEMVNFDTLQSWLIMLGLEMVPVLYRGPYSDDKVKELTSGKSTYDKNQIREGIVITPCKERYDNTLGRVILKSVSEDYKLRKNATEFN